MTVVQDKIFGKALIFFLGEGHSWVPVHWWMQHKEEIEEIGGFCVVAGLVTHWNHRHMVG